MYRAIFVNSDDQQLQKIVWRESPEQPIQSFQLTTVTYGTKAAPFLAIMSLKQLAADERERYPEAAAILEGSYYVDDLLHGSYTIDHGKRMIHDLIQLLKSGGFNLRKWSSNNQELLKTTQECTENTVFNFKAEDTSKTLGLCWNSKEDHFTFKCNFSKSTSKLTKRQLLSEISKLFDPLGWLTPLSTKLKLLFQKLWKENIQWDDEVSDGIRNEWCKILTNIDNINRCVIPRWLLSYESDVIELHGFCDASISAYACVVYARSKLQQKTVIVAAKSKLVPHKKALTLPQAELCGAHLLSKLLYKIKQSLSNQIELYGWCDSMVVLGWLHGEPTRWKPFVANRVHAITQVMPAETWRYVKSEENAADAASRGITAIQLIHHDLWWHGPSWLSTFDHTQKDQQQPIYKTEEEIKHIKQVNIVQQTDNDIIYNLLLSHNSFIKIVRVFTWILRALTPIARRQHLPNYLTLQELRKAKSAIIKYVQHRDFGMDIEKLKKGGLVATNSKIFNLSPFVDSEGILRVGGRLRNANISDDMKHPKLISNKSRLAELLIDEAHKLSFHSGPRLTLATLRRQYWITSGYSTTKAQLRNCVTCRKQQSSKNYQLMGDLPAARINQAAPFYHTGVDYTGFVDIKPSKGKAVRTIKGYVAVFVCLVTKALHLELVSDLTSSAFLAALKRMAARKGTPRHLYSDQGTNFIGANRLLKEEYEQLQVIQNSLMTDVADMNIEWHFNAPSWPSAGGLWERAVQSLKHHLRRVVGEQRLTFEEFSTILAQLEACLNSRPLCSLTENIEDLDYLSPAHFLTGRPGLTVMETKEDARTRWHLSNNILKHIWQKWKNEYLSQLTTREKWARPQRNIKIGDLVVLHDDNIPVGKWPLGRVLELFPGSDGYVRVVSIKTKNGIIKRPIVKLSVLPLETADQSNIVSETNETKRNIRPDHNNKQKGKTTRGRLSHIVMALTLFLTFCGNANCEYTKIEIPNNQSIYFDPISKMNLIKDTWTMVVYYNMSPYWEGVRAFNKIITYIDKTCITIGGGQCNMIVAQLTHEYNELNYYNELLMTHQQVRDRSRLRRGLINGVGYVANSLFGVLDEHFAEQYQRDIGLIKQNEKHLVNLWKNQTSIIESEYNLLKRTEEIMDKQHKIINKHLLSLDVATNNLQFEVNNMALRQEFTITALTATNLLHNLKGTQEVLLDILTNVHHGQFNIHLLTPEQMQKELSIISHHLTDDTKLPVENNNLQNLYQLLSIKTRITDEYLLFQITLPLTSRDNFMLYKLLPIPHQIGTKIIEPIPYSEYLATDLKRDLYITLSSEELRKCTKQEDVLYCDVKQPIRHLNTDRIFCTIDHDTDQCKVKRSKCENKWTPLANPSLYLYHCCDICNIKIICADQIRVEQLAEAGIIHLERGCLLKGQDFTVHVQKSTENKVEMSANIYTPKLDQLNFIINSSLPVITASQNSTDSSEIKNAIETLHSRIDEIKNSPTEVEESLSSHDIHQYVVSYALVGAGALGAGALLWRRRRGASRARISRDIELQPVTSAISVSETVSSVKTSARPNMAEQQPSARHIYGIANKNRACSPLPRRPLGTLRFEK